MLEIKQQLIERARAEGFELCRVTRPDAIPEAAPRLRDFLAQGFHGDMDWMAEHEIRRASPENLWPEARSVIMLAMNYGPDKNPLEDLSARRYVIAVSRHCWSVMMPLMPCLRMTALSEFETMAHDWRQTGQGRTRSHRRRYLSSR